MIMSDPAATLGSEAARGRVDCPGASPPAGPGTLFPGSGDAAISRAQAVTQRIEQAILRSEFAPGDRLGTKSELQKEFRVAAGTINEALRMLQMHGLVEIRPGPGGGVFVATASPGVKLRHGILRFRDGGHAARECIAVRNALEELVAAEAARSREPGDLEELYRLLDHMAGNAGHTARFIRSNWALHRKIAELGTNTVLTSVYCMLLDFIEETLEEALPDEAFSKEAANTLHIHRALVDAIASGNPERAARAAREHTPGMTLLHAHADGADG
jgi:DNA-binding FadR family transcriptional regulator